MLTAYDPAVSPERTERLAPIGVVDDPYLVAKDAGAIVLLTGWPEFAELDWSRLATLADEPVVVDTRQLLDEAVLEGAEVRHIGVGRRTRRYHWVTTKEDRHMATEQASAIIENWPEESKEPAELVIDAYGEPDEATPSLLIWYDKGPWKRIVASKAYYPHEFPIPHIDSVESFIDYRVPPEKFTPLAEFDGSVIAERTAGEVSARCHDEQANFLALNLMHDIVTGEKTVDEARAYYGKEFLDFRRNKATPYMEKLRFEPASDGRDLDGRVLSDEELERAATEGEDE